MHFPVFDVTDHLKTTKVYIMVVFIEY